MGDKNEEGSDKKQRLRKRRFDEIQPQDSDEDGDDDASAKVSLKLRGSHNIYIT